MIYASVAVPVPVRRLFTYGVPDGERVEPGQRVRVRFGNRKLEATVVECPVDPPQAGVDVRAIERVLPDERRLPEQVLELTRFVADYYLCSWGDAIEAALPPAPPRGRPRVMLRRSPVADPASLGPRATARRRLLDALPDDGTAVPIERLDEGARRVAPALVRCGWVERIELDAPLPSAVAGRLGEPAEAGPSPTPEQRAVIGELEHALDRREYAPFVLFGATGSGKTEVYLRAVEAALAQGRTALFLVPEIGLTPLLLSRVERRFPGKVAVQHSGLAPGRRYAAWHAARSGEARLLVGTRSAIFSPLERLGLIVVDEEQDGSYKQDETPRYNARDLAVLRARREGAAVVLGSATPSMESFHHAVSGRYGLLRLGARIGGRPLAQVRTVDMRVEYAAAGRVTFLSAELARGLSETFERGEQAIVLRNRRGWAASTMCTRCGQRVGCDRCSIPFTWHRSAARLRCHYCGREERMPETCPTCGFADEPLNLLGEGTERIEEEVRAAVPAARIERMDRDTIRRRGAHEALLRRFDTHEIDILVGTQMVAKGHDFPRVTLVGVVSADHALGLPDFRAGERVFQLLTQVAGRAGRGTLPGTVVVQAFDPEHPVLVKAAQQDYEAFYRDEIRYRRALRYPPLSAMVQLRVVGREAHRARRWAQALGDALRAESGGRLVVSGPGPAPIERIQDRFRQQILVRSAGRRRLVEAVDRAIRAVEGDVPARAIQVDVDPYHLL